MRNDISSGHNPKRAFRLSILVAMLVVLCATPILSVPHTQTALTIVNNSTQEIRHVYLSPVDNNNWGPDQLHGAMISPGQTVTLNISWEAPTVKLIGEDQNGCFLYNTVDVTGDATWTIAREAVPDCGD